MTTLSRRQLLAVGAAAATLGLVGCSARRVTKSAEVRELLQVVDARPGRDGAGVALRRSLGSRSLPLLDPFLLLDEIHSDRPQDYEAGFPDHPHRGFETVSILLRGAFEHRDSVGHHGLIADGGVQWMTAGRGLVHSEMPRPTASPELWGLQLWVNLPAKDKWRRPRYQDLAAATIPTVDVADAQVRVIAGQVGRTRGPVDGIVTAPTLFDATLAPGARLLHELPGTHTAFVYGLAGAARLGARGETVGAGQLGVLAPGRQVLAGTVEGARFLLLAAAPIGEPVARRGPFVMNTEAELDQAFADYRSGRLAG